MKHPKQSIGITLAIALFMLFLSGISRIYDIRQTIHGYSSIICIIKAKNRKKITFIYAIEWLLLEQKTLPEIMN